MSEGAVILAGGNQDLEQLLHYGSAPAKKKSGLKTGLEDHYETADGQLIPNGSQIIRRPAEPQTRCFFTSASGITIPARNFVDTRRPQPDPTWEEKMPSWRSPMVDSTKYRPRQLPGPTSIRKMG